VETTSLSLLLYLVITLTYILFPTDQNYNLYNSTSDALQLKKVYINYEKQRLLVKLK